MQEAVVAVDAGRVQVDGSLLPRLQEAGVEAAVVGGGGVGSAAGIDESDDGAGGHGQLGAAVGGVEHVYGYRGNR